MFLLTKIMRQLGSLIGPQLMKLVKLAIKGLKWCFVSFPRTAVWVLAFMFLIQTPLAYVMVVIFFLAMFASYLPKMFAKVGNIYPGYDWTLRSERAQAELNAAAFNEVIESMGMDRDVTGKLTEDGNRRVLVIWTHSAKVGETEVAAAAVRAVDFMKCESVTTRQPKPGVFEVVFYRVTPPNPLSNTKPLTEPKKTVSLSKVPMGIRKDGSTVFFNFENRSGAVIGGVPGSGKSSGLIAMLASMADMPNVQATIADGKGGSDWEWTKKRYTWINDDEDFDVVIEALEKLTATMRDRLQNLKSITGTPNIWHGDGPTKEMPLQIFILDECQTWFDTKGMNPEKKKKAERILALATGCVKKGRSAGIFLFAVTQKPTADSLPTALRDNCSEKICLRVITEEAGISVLGDRGFPSPTDIPKSLNGGAVVVNEGGDREEIRFDYLPDSQAEIAANANSHLKRSM